MPEQMLNTQIESSAEMTNGIVDAAVINHKDMFYFMQILKQFHANPDGKLKQTGGKSSLLQLPLG